MKKHILSILLILCISSSAFSQKKEKVIKYQKTFYKDQTVENMDVKITIDDDIYHITNLNSFLLCTKIQNSEYYSVSYHH